MDNQEKPATWIYKTQDDDKQKHYTIYDVGHHCAQKTQ